MKAVISICSIAGLISVSVSAFWLLIFIDNSLVTSFIPERTIGILWMSATAVVLLPAGQAAYRSHRSRNPKDKNENFP
jgi:hypothetical protein